MSWITRAHHWSADRVHPQGDAFTESAGWTVTRTAGPFGSGIRVYRDSGSTSGEMGQIGPPPSPGSAKASTLIAACNSDGRHRHTRSRLAVTGTRQPLFDLGDERPTENHSTAGTSATPTVATLALGESRDDTMARSR
jgi:hypothetical protein